MGVRLWRWLFRRKTRPVVGSGTSAVTPVLPELTPGDYLVCIVDGKVVWSKQVPERQGQP